VTVLDEWQGRGAATALLAALTERCPPGVTDLATQVAVGNAASMAMLRRLGAVRITGT
jgi:RimJ/RimL family protein N-acetyltransferase